MDERNRYVAIELTFDDEGDPDYNWYDVLTELEEHLLNNGYDYFTSSMPQYEQIFVLLINEEQTGYIDTVLEDRGIKYSYM